MCLQKFQSLTLDQNDPWNEARIDVFFSYVDILFGKIFDVLKNLSNGTNRFYREDDLQALSKVATSENEPVVCRVRAYDLLGKFGSFTLDEFGESLGRFEDALDLCKSTGSTDRQRNIVVRKQTVNVGDWLKKQEHSLEEFVSGKSGVLLHNRFSFPAWSPNGWQVDAGSLAGLRCDYCEKPREGELLVCSKCRMAHYCNSDCQLKAWSEHGHNKVCRKPGVFKVGDQAVTFEPFGERTTFGGHVKIVEACPMEGSTKKRPSHWVVKCKPEIGNDIGTVPSERLRLLRQPLWDRFSPEDLERIHSALTERDRLAAEQDRNDDDEEKESILPELIDRRGL